MTRGGPWSWTAWASGQAASIRRAGRWRTLRPLDGGGHVFQLDGRRVVSFASNDYLGLTQHPAVVAAAHEALDRYGAGAGAARLIVGARPVHDELERELAAWKGEERALVFPTGFAANLGVLTVVGGEGVTVCSDELNHASIIDGCRLSRAAVAVYRHRDLDHLASILDSAERAVVVTDTVFSMDGEVADLVELTRLCAASRALLVVDEAHAVLGPDLPRLDGLEVLRVGTLSKTLGSLGGFVAGPAPLVELVLNRARPFIFTTAPTPADSAAALAALRVVRSAEGEARLARLRRNVELVRRGHPSPIVPIVLGGEQEATAAADALLDRGLLVPAIRPPTVAPGSSRLRVTLSADHDPADVGALVAALASLGAGGG